MSAPTAVVQLSEISSGEVVEGIDNTSGQLVVRKRAALLRAKQHDRIIHVVLHGPAIAASRHIFRFARISSSRLSGIS
ncbi:hypothetical protein [Burkholderia sp. ABCPW 11]|uniref:hypothetical protein n=1 Tax=Burkholderia sp. ABCPW 11 TaxID=1637859 RepID=UPI0012FDA7F4|nr:hypothetical protein [Burkholderia sp. ABCPW 11]